MKQLINNKSKKTKIDNNKFEEEVVSKLLEAEQEMEKNSKRYTSEEVIERLKKSIG